MHKIIVILAAFLYYTGTGAQEVDLFKTVDEEKSSDNNRTEYTTATFKSTRLINGHTIETTAEGVLDLKVSHRFGAFSEGSYEAFGLDNATMRIGLDYGLKKMLTIGIGRSTFEKQYDAFIKYKLFAQSSGKLSFPVTVTWLSTVILRTIRLQEDSNNKNYYSDKLSYAHQLLIARKFNDNTSLQVVPTLIHFNKMVEGLSNDILAVGIGGRQKISKRISINAEYYYVPTNNKLPGSYNPLSIGFDIETGGHVFQLHFTNSTGMTEKSFIAETTDRWSKGDIHFGFNISRVFTFGKKKK
jgi:hypothetical protein